MTGEVKLLKKMEKNIVTFDDLRDGEGLVNKNGVRIRVGTKCYLHFSVSGLVLPNPEANWPPEMKGEIRRFHLSAEEI